MKLHYYLLALLLVFGPQPSPYRKSNGYLIPAPSLTPGVVRTADTAVYCHQKTSTVRHTSAALKDSVYKEFGWSLKSHPKGEIDHLVPLELGGADVRRNLWFQPNGEFQVKDSVENWARKQVCSGLMNGVYAQQLFRLDWTRLLLRSKRRVLPFTPAMGSLNGPDF